jgi:hypothetical protein
MTGFWSCVFVAAASGAIGILALFHIRVSGFDAWILIDASLFAVVAWRIWKMSRLWSALGLAYYATATYDKLAGGPGTIRRQSLRPTPESLRIRVRSRPLIVPDRALRNNVSAIERRGISHYNDHGRGSRSFDSSSRRMARSWFITLACRRGGECAGCGFAFRACESGQYRMTLASA